MQYTVSFICICKAVDKKYVKKVRQQLTHG